MFTNSQVGDNHSDSQKPSKAGLTSLAPKSKQPPLKEPSPLETSASVQVCVCIMNRFILGIMNNWVSVQKN